VPDAWGTDRGRCGAIPPSKSYPAQWVLTLVRNAPSQTPAMMTLAGRRNATPKEVVASVARDFGLTRREREVLAHAANGNSIKEIAFQVGVTARNIEYFWRRIFAKLRCGSQLRVMALLLRRACHRSRESSRSCTGS
jgi:DNA-binding CsgD family transcriptional regulator